MKKLKKLSLLLASMMLMGMLSACVPANHSGDSSSPIDSSSSNEEQEKPEKPVEKVIDLEGQTSLYKTVEKANQLANGVQAYFVDGDRKSYVVENEHVQLEHTLTDSIFVSSLKNSSGGQYLHRPAFRHIPP